jgi:hypothetical protein
MLYEQMKQSVELKAEVAHFKRTPADRNYEFLLRTMQRFIDDHRVEQNRRSQTQSYKGTQDPNALASNPKPKGGGKNSSSASNVENQGAQSTKSPHPCFFYQTDECKMTADKCRYQHVKISKADFEALKKKREDAKANKPKEAGASTSSKPRATSPKGQKGSPKSKICYSWQNTGTCPNQSACKYEHPPEGKGVKPIVKSLIAAETSEDLSATSAVAVVKQATAFMSGGAVTARIFDPLAIAKPAMCDAEEGRAPKNPDGWLRSSKHGAWIRIHHKPGQFLFTPMNVSNGPPKESLSSTRLSVIRYITDPTIGEIEYVDSTPTRMVDEWTDKTLAHKKIG